MYKQYTLMKKRNLEIHIAALLLVFVCYFLYYITTYEFPRIISCFIDFCIFGNKINWRDVQRNYFVNNVDKSSLRAPRQSGTYKQTLRTARNVKNNKTLQTFTTNHFCVFVLFNSLVDLLKRVNRHFCLFLLQKMLKKCEVCCSGKLV